MRLIPLFTLAFVAIPLLAFAAEPTSPAVALDADGGALMLPSGSVAIPSTIVNMLMVYLSDRSGIATQLQQGIAQASQVKPLACPLPGDKK